MTSPLRLNAPASEEQIRDAEHRFGHRFPREYRDWLKVSDGARSRQLLSLPDGDFDIHEIAGVVPDGDDCVYLQRMQSDLVTDDFLVVSVCDVGTVMVKVTQPDEDSVWFLDNEYVGLEYDYAGAGYPSLQAYLCGEKITRVTDSFLQFVNGLVVTDR